MRQIEIDNGYMVCVLCRGYVEAENQTPPCECIEDDQFFSSEEEIAYN